jgi:8-oxo-dGTP pyrophosphatase MutT (NUDIX family)
MYNINIGEANIPINMPIKVRLGVRGVVVNDDKFLMLTGNNGYYSFAGGGIEQGETIEQAIIREMREETGYSVTGVSRLLGIENNYRVSRVLDKAFYHMIYYVCLCEIDLSVPPIQQLEAHEETVGLRAAWITPQDAINQNCLVGVEAYNRGIEIIQQELLYEENF